MTLAVDLQRAGVCIRNVLHPLDVLGTESLSTVARRAIGVAILKRNEVKRGGKPWTTSAQRKTK